MRIVLSITCVIMLATLGCVSKNTEKNPFDAGYVILEYDATQISFESDPYGPLLAVRKAFEDKGNYINVCVDVELAELFRRTREERPAKKRPDYNLSYAGIPPFVTAKTLLDTYCALVGAKWCQYEDMIIIQLNYCRDARK